MSQVNALLASLNSSVMAQLAKMAAIIIAMQAQLNTISATSTNSTRTNMKYYCSRCGINFTHGSKTCSSKKTCHKKQSHCKKTLEDIEKGCEWQFGEIINKIKIRTPKIILINNIGAPPNYSSKYTLAISDSGTNIHLANQSTSTMAPVLVSKYMTASLPDGSITEFYFVSTLRLPGLSKQARQIQILPKIRTVPLI